MNASDPLPAAFIPPAPVKPRNLRTALHLARCCPGLGHIYAGDILRGLVFLAAVDLPLILGSLFIIEPRGNLWIALGLWCLSLVFSVWSVMDAKKVLLRTRPDYRMKDYNHWLAYLVIAVIPTLAVGVGCAVAIASTHTATLVQSGNRPALDLQDRDRFIQWKSAYWNKSPQPGERVTYRPALAWGTSIGEIAGLPGDRLTTTWGDNTVVPERSVAVRRPDGLTEIAPDVGISGQVVYRFWPLTRIGRITPHADPH